MKKIMFIIFLIFLIILSCDEENNKNNNTLYLTILIQTEDIDLGYGVAVPNSQVSVYKDIQSYFSGIPIITGIADTDGKIKILNSKIKDGDAEIGSNGIRQSGIIFVFAEKDDLNNWADPKEFLFDNNIEGNIVVSIEKSYAYHLINPSPWKLKRIAINSQTVSFDECYHDNSITFSVLEGNMLMGYYSEGPVLCVQDLDTTNSYFTIPLSNT